MTESKTKEHVKFIFIYLDKINDNKKCKVYLIGYAYDSNEISIEKYRESSVKNKSYNGWSKIFKFKANILNHNIDKDTIVTISDNVKKNSIFFQLFDFMHVFSGMTLRHVHLPIVLTKLDSSFHLFNEDVKTIRNASNSSLIRKFTTAYNFILETRICPWINVSFDNKIYNMSAVNQRGYKICAVGLYYMAVYSYCKTVKV